MILEQPTLKIKILFNNFFMTFKNDEPVVVEDDFSLLIYKISEVSNSEGGIDSWRVVDV